VRDGLGSPAVVQPFSATKSRNAHVITMLLSRRSSHDRYHRSLCGAMRLGIHLCSTCGIDGTDRVSYPNILGGAEIEEIAGSPKFDAIFRSTGKLKHCTAKLSQRYPTAVTTTTTHQRISSLYYSWALRLKHPDETGSRGHCAVYPIAPETHL
jgi:hypothetical protein